MSDQIQQGPAPEPLSTKERIKAILAEDISGHFEVRWYPIGDGEDHDSWQSADDFSSQKTRPADSKYRDVFDYVAEQILEVVKANLA